jgi:hypothetical protein
MTLMFLTRKPYHEWRGIPFSIRDGGGFLISGRNVLMSNGGGEPFGNGGNNAQEIVVAVL